jgi:hypothetical protein
MKTLKEQMNPTEAERALNIAELTLRKLQVLESRVSSQDKRFSGIVKDAAAQVSSSTKFLVKQTVRDQNEYVLEMIAERVIDNRVKTMGLWRKIKVLFGGRGW